MSNPTTPFPFYSFKPDEDAAKLNQDFDALVAFMTTQLIHAHHVQVATFNLPALTSNTSASVTGITWPQAFPAGVTPVVLAQQNETAGPSTGIVTLVFLPFNITNTGCDVRVWNSGSTSVAVTGGGKLVAIDPTFDTSQ